MVFSFFKKQPEKMVTRPAAVPRPPEKPSGNEPAAAPLTAEAAALELSDFVFSESAPDFQVEVDMDPVDANAEEAAVLFSNGQDNAVRVVLENAIHIHHFGPGERLWLMLFDLFRINGQKPDFDALGIEFARAFEKSPPAWGEKTVVMPKAKVVAGNLSFKGDLTGDNAPAFDAIRQSLMQHRKLRLDLAKVASVDASGCGQLLALLQHARKNKQEIEVLGRDALGALLQTQVEAGKAEHPECWLLLLEVCQLQGRQDAFEDVAINYAITFEVSPPSWESSRVAAPEPESAMSVEAGASPALADVYVLRGEVKSSRFADLPEYAEAQESVVIDCSALVRMDFISAGALLNVLTPIRRAGKPIIFRHPNHLVAELFKVLGLNAVAMIVFAKN